MPKNAVEIGFAQGHGSFRRRFEELNGALPTNEEIGMVFIENAVIDPQVVSRCPLDLDEPEIP